MAKGGNGTRTESPTRVAAGRTGSVESQVRSAIKSAGWKDQGGGVYYIDTESRGFGGGTILKDTDDRYRFEYGSRTIYEVQDVFDKDYSITSLNRKGFTSLADAKKFVEQELIRRNSKK
ncbi:MAG: hypothetical protein J5733_04860 [Bacteroidaceae bacterium]|nr:hypothetical protein [Bacteroidaceae bacterium]